MSNDLIQRWANQWAKAGPAMDAVRKAELRALTDEDVRRSVADLFASAINTDQPQQLSSGLVEQQRLFASLRRPA